MARTRKRGSLVAARPPGHPLSPPARGCSFARNTSDPLGRCRFHELESCYIDTYGTTRTHRQRCTCSIHSHVLHAGQITTDTDIGSSRTYEEETRDASTTTIDSIARATNKDILRFGIFLPSSSVEKREAESGRRKFGSVRGKRRRVNVVVATRGRFGYAWD